MVLSPFSKGEPVPSLVIVLTDGFAGEDVVVTVGGVEHGFPGARTQLLTGLAQQRTVTLDEDEPVVVTARLDPGGTHTPQHAAAPGNTVEVALTDTGLSIAVHEGLVGFA